MDPEQAVSDYEAAVKELQASEIPAVLLEPPSEPVPERKPPRASLAVGFAVVLGLLAYAGWNGYLRQREPGPELATAETRQPQETNVRVSDDSPANAALGQEQALPEAEATALPAVSPGDDARQPTGFELRIRALQDCWMSITADGKRILSEVIPASAERAVMAHEEIVLTVGNAGGLELFYDGMPVPALGGTGQVRTVTFTSEGLLR
jgi:hypothetical protein